MCGVDARRVSGETLDAGDARLLADDHRCLVVARVDARHGVAVGDVVDLTVDTTELHFFDPATGAALEAAA